MKTNENNPLKVSVSCELDRFHDRYLAKAYEQILPFHPRLARRLVSSLNPTNYFEGPVIQEA